MDDMIKLAQEYDAAGRVMARGFYDEMQKLAGKRKKGKKGRKSTGKNGAVHMFLQN